ncbi:MAG: hypothetical protein ABEH66_07725 [Halobacteriales archaeon]
MGDGETGVAHPSDGEAGAAQTSHWERWTGDSGPFYRACAVVPFDSYSEQDAVSSEQEQPEVQFTTGLPRTLLRNLPTFLLLILAIYVPALTFHFTTTGRIQLDLPRLSVEAVGLLVPGVLVGGLWLYLIYRVFRTSLRGSSFHQSIVFFVTAIPLTAGTGYAAYTAWIPASTVTDPAITVQAGYFLFVLLAGHLVYDGLALKTENLFARLGDTSIVRQPAYDDFYAELADTLGDTLDIGPVSVPRSVGFALIVALVPILLPVIVTPWQWWGELAYVAYSIVTLFVIAVLYDVFILVYKFTELLQRDILAYRPFHPDDRGGFRDLGRFATRVNAILVVAGGYVVYRFYAEGILNLPDGGFGPSLEAVTWAVLYLGPVVAYVFLVAFWLYNSFWRLHRKMEQGRQQRIEELQRTARRDHENPDNEFTDLETDAPAWESLQGAPTWPIKRQSLVGIIAIDAVPVVMTFVV